MEFLKGLLSEETYAQVEEQLKDKDIKLANLKEGGYVSVDKYNTLQSEFETTRDELQQRTDDLTKLGESANASEQMKVQIDEIKESFEKKQLEYTAKLEKNKFDSIVNLAVVKSGTNDEVAVKAHLQEFLSTAKLNEAQDDIEGLADKLNAIKEERPQYYEKAQATALKHKQKLGNETIEDQLRSGFGLKPKQ